MFRKIAYAFYYAVIYNLPHSRFVPFVNKIRMFYVSKVLGIMPSHANSRFQHNVYIGGPGAVTIGKNCQINEYAFLQGATIGDNVMIAPYVAFVANEKNYLDPNKPMNMQGRKAKGLKVIIEDDVWIARNVIIMPGIRVGKGSILAAGAVITKDVPPYSVVGGVPGKVIKSRKPT